LSKLLDLINQESVLFGATSLEGKQLFRQYDWFNANTFLDYLKEIHRKFPKCYLFLDKAKQHYNSKRILEYFDKHKKNLIPIYLPTASPEFMVLEEIWHIYSQERSSCTTTVFIIYRF
jgi:DDE superfamily endonuclease